MQTTKRRVVIACQGGGSHTAFTAGVLSRFLQPDVLAEHEIVGLSGTSGGAICATLAWSALLAGKPENAAVLLDQFWTANMAKSLPERAANSLGLLGARLGEYMALPAISPYFNMGASWGTQQLRSMLDDAVDLVADQQKASELGEAAPLLVLGAVDVLKGSFKAFSSRRGEISNDAILASAAIPNLFRSVRIGEGVYWDGLFSQNPPIDALWAADPDEYWVIQVNPTVIDEEPKMMSEIETRRNELAGNLSLYQELGFIEVVDRWLADGTISSDRVRHMNVRILEMKRPASVKQWGYASKLNRDPAFITELMQLGRDQADDQLLAMAFERAFSLEDTGQMLADYAPNVVLSSDHPAAPLPPTQDRETIQAYMDRIRVHLDSSRKRVCRAGVTWDVRANAEIPSGGKIAAVFEDGLVTRITLSEGRAS